MTTQSDEASFLQNLVPMLQAEGYEVYLQPTTPIAPPFLEGFRPDVIAIGNDKKLIIELVSGAVGKQQKTRALADLVAKHPEWEFRVLVVPAAKTTAVLRPQSLDEVQSAIREVKALEDGNHAVAALLLAWGTFEAISRRLMANSFERPQSPGRLVQLMAQEGYVTPSEADQLRALTKKRNDLIHGNLDVRTDKAEVAAFRSILERLAAEPFRA